MIQKKTLEAVRKGVLTDDQLLEAIEHYQMLELMLRPHGDRYFLVWSDAKQEFDNLETMLRLRREDKKGEGSTKKSLTVVK